MLQFKYNILTHYVIDINSIVEREQSSMITFDARYCAIVYQLSRCDGAMSFPDL